MLRKALPVALFALALAGDGSARTVVAPESPCPGVGTTALAGIDRLFDQAPETRAVALEIDGCRAATRFAEGYSPGDRFISWSMAKSVTAMLVGTLVADGRLGLDDPLPLAEWQGKGNPHRAISLRQMLNMESGVRHVEVGDPVEKSDTNQALFVTGTGAMAKAAFAEPVEVPPGSRWQYDTLTSVLLAELIARTLTDSRDPRVRAQAYREFAETRLFRPAGVTSAFLEFDGSGTQVGGSMIYMTLDDWVRMGRLLLDGKGPGGAQVIAPEWLAFMKTPAPHRAEYGGHVWLNHDVPGEHVSLFPGKGPDSTVAMDGHLGQLVIAAEGPVGGTLHRVVLVRLGNTPDRSNSPLMQDLGDIVEAVIPRFGTVPRSR